MAQFFLINAVTFSGVRYLPGESVDDTVLDAVGIRAAGGLLWTASDATVAAAAAKAQSAHKNRGASEEVMYQIMVTAVDSVQRQNDQFGTAVLVAGVAVVNTPQLNAGSEAIIGLKTPGGTTGVNYKYAIVPGAPGAGTLTITAVAADGTTVATDTSTVVWEIKG